MSETGHTVSEEIMQMLPNRVEVLSQEIYSIEDQEKIK